MVAIGTYREAQSQLGSSQSISTIQNETIGEMLVTIIELFQPIWRLVVFYVLSVIYDLSMS